MPLLRPALLLACLISLAPGLAGAVTFLGFDDAKTLGEGELQLGAQGVFADEISTVGALGRLGLIGPLDLTARAGLTEISDRVGFELEASPRFQLLTARQTAGIVGVALVGNASVLKTGEVLALGLDAGGVISRSFEVGRHRQLRLAGTLGLATTYTEISQGDDVSDHEAGFMVGAMVGFTVARHLEVVVEGRVRDAFERVGAGVLYQF